MANTTNTILPQRPEVGQRINVNRPGTYVVRRVYALGTCDVKRTGATNLNADVDDRGPRPTRRVLELFELVVECLETGTWLRLTGLGWA